MINKVNKELTEFESGAVRDIKTLNGRCDLLPLSIVGELIRFSEDVCGASYEQIFYDLNSYAIKKNLTFLYHALSMFILKTYPDIYTAMLELSIHYKEGSEKYDEWNWTKGIPTHSYIDSAVRHLLKYLRGDTDESHDRAFMWNIVCCIWTALEKPELDDVKN